ncbi:MAG: type IV pilus twitching motility protein PilT, partial [Candidatus Eisenbacteria bacterium]|nr:type IV pilus twitching motility protein PilT [Candidatus Eisenbacteria bacterium]
PGPSTGPGGPGVLAVPGVLGSRASWRSLARLPPAVGSPRLESVNPPAERVDLRRSGFGAPEEPWGARPPGGRSGQEGQTARIDAIFRMVKEQGASDLHISTGSVPMLRLHGDLFPVAHPELSGDQARRLLLEMMTEEQREHFERDRDIDFAYELPGELRVRCNVFEQLRGIAGAFRLLPTQIFSLEELGLPEQIARFADLSKGLVVVTGPPGSGKSSTLAALLHHINQRQRRHIITIEDPVEFVHKNARCLINHREIGVSAVSFASALRAALREDPDIILVGEMRDLETMQLAITAAETGQLVLGTLHTASAAQTVDRIIDAFTEEKQAQIRVMLAESLRGVVAQRLVRRADGEGRVAAVEILISTTAISSLVRERKTFQIPTLMQTGKKDGMQLLDAHLMQLVKDGTVRAEDAVVQAQVKEPFLALLAPKPRLAA